VCRACLRVRNTCVQVTEMSCKVESDPPKKRVESCKYEGHILTESLLWLLHWDQRAWQLGLPYARLRQR